MNKTDNPGFELHQLDGLPAGMTIIAQSEDPLSVLERAAVHRAQPILSAKVYTSTGSGRGGFKFRYDLSKPLAQWPAFTHSAVSGCGLGLVTPENQVYSESENRWFKYEGPGPVFRSSLGKPANRQKSKATARSRKKSLKYGWVGSNVAFMFSTKKQWYAPRFRIKWTGHAVHMEVVFDAHDEFCFTNTQLEFKGNASR